MSAVVAHAGLPLGASGARTMLWRAAAGALLVLQVALALTHVPWRDETQALGIALGSPTLSALLANLRYEGHPALWYLVLQAASHVLPRSEILPVAAATISGGTLLILWFCSPFRPALRLAIGASHLMLFEYGTVARSYGLGVLLAVAYLACRRRPAGWLLLALLANVSAHFLLLSGALVLLGALTEGRRSTLGVAFWLLGCALAAWTAFPVADAVPAIPLDPSVAMRALRFNLEATAVLAPLGPLGLGYAWLGEALPAWCTVGGAYLPLLVWLSLRKGIGAALIGLGLFAALAALSLLVYPASARHLGVMVLFVIASEWMRLDTVGGEPSPVLRAWMGVSAILGLAIAAHAAVTPFTRVREVVRWVEATGLRAEAWATFPGYEGSLLAAELGRPVYDPGHSCVADFMRWDAGSWPSQSAVELSENLAAAAGRAGGRLLVLAEDSRVPHGVTGWRPLRTVASGLGSAPATVYLVEAPAGPGRMSLCPWTRPGKG